MRRSSCLGARNAFPYVHLSICRRPTALCRRTSSGRMTFLKKTPVNPYHRRSALATNRCVGGPDGIGDPRPASLCMRRAVSTAYYYALFHGSLSDLRRIHDELVRLFEPDRAVAADRDPNLLDHRARGSPERAFDRISRESRAASMRRIERLGPCLFVDTFRNSATSADYAPARSYLQARRRPGLLIDDARRCDFDYAKTSSREQRAASRCPTHHQTSLIAAFQRSAWHRNVRKMKFTLSWLKDHLDTEASLDDHRRDA